MVLEPAVGVTVTPTQYKPVVDIAFNELELPDTTTSSPIWVHSDAATKVPDVVANLP